jgi:hypothetical protein
VPRDAAPQRVEQLFELNDLLVRGVIFGDNDKHLAEKHVMLCAPPVQPDAPHAILRPGFATVELSSLFSNMPLRCSATGAVFTHKNIQEMPDAIRLPAAEEHDVELCAEEAQRRGLVVDPRA